MKNRIKSLLTLGLVWQCTVVTAEADDKMALHLLNLQAEYQRHTATKPAESFSSSDRSVQIVKHRSVTVDITCKDQAQAIALMDKLKQLGVPQLSRYKKLVSALVPIDRLSQLNHYAEVSWINSNKASLNAFGPAGGLAYNAADPAMFTDVVRKRYNVDGSGVTIGVLSDSYNCLEGEASDIESGDLPADVEVLKEYPFCEEEGTDEGRAMMQLIHDIAPGAKLMFYTAFVGAVDFAAGIQKLADAGADIIVDDVRYFTMPMFQEGPIAQSVNEVKARGVSYFSSAGNYARLSYENDYTPRINPISNDLAHDFGSAAGGAPGFYQKLTIPSDTPTRIMLQWDEPAEIAGGEGAKSDIDMFLMDNTKKRVFLSSQNYNIGHDPIEFIYIEHASETPEFYLYISHRAGPVPTKIKYVIGAPPAPWGDGTEAVEIDPRLAFTDGSPFGAGTAVMLFDHEILALDLNNVDAAGSTTRLDENSRPYVIIDNQVVVIGPGTDYPVYFVPEGYRYTQAPGGKIRLYPDIEGTPFSIDQYPTFSGTVFGHPNASGAMAVGAIPYYETPWFGTPINQSLIENFSSAGGTPILFRPDGTRLPQADLRPKQFIVAPDATDTTFFTEDTDNNQLPNFSGTSAAAPHAAAVAALLKEAFPKLTPDEVYQAMMKGSVDLHDPAEAFNDAPNNGFCSFASEFDWGSGCGLIQADLMFDAIGTKNNDVLLSLNASTPRVTAGRPFRYQFKLMNFSDVDLENVRVRAQQLPQYVRFDNIEGCLDIDQQEVSCRLGAVAAGEIRNITLETTPFNNPSGTLSFTADVLTDSGVNLLNAQTRLDIGIQDLSGDFNHDGCVDQGDWGQLYGVFRAGMQNAVYDLNQDGQFNMADFDALERLYSNPPSGAACH